MLTVAGRSTFGHVVRRTGVEIHVHLLLVAHVARNTIGTHADTLTIGAVSSGVLLKIEVGRG